MLIKKVFLYGHFRVIIQLLSSYEGNKILPLKPLSSSKWSHDEEDIFMEREIARIAVVHQQESLKQFSECSM